MFVVSGCASDGTRKPESLEDSISYNEFADLNEAQAGLGNSSDALSQPSDSESVVAAGSQDFPVPSIATDAADIADDNISAPPEPQTEFVDAAVRELPLPDFIDVVFGEMAQVPFFTGPNVASRQDVIVKMRTSGQLASNDFLELAIEALEEYGVSTVAEDGVYKLIDSASLRSRMPRFIRARATPDTPGALRPLVMFVDLDAIGANEMMQILRQAFPDANRLKIAANQRINVITLTGLPEDVENAVRVIEQMDELAYAGTQLVRYSPNFITAKELADQMAQMLSIEGWQASSNPSVNRTVVTIPVEFTNDLFVFSKSQVALERARFWLSQLDQPSKIGEVPQLFVYAVQNVDAVLLADTVNAVLSNGSRPPASVSGPASGAAPSPIGGSSVNIPGSIVVDRISNRLIFSGSASDYARLRPLLEQLDRPPGEVLILVTIAEVTLTDETQYGLQFFVDSIGGTDFVATAGTSGIGVGSSGLNVEVFSGNVDLAVNAFASNSQVNVLSKPKLVARSGGAARLQVGTDVPVITSQRAASAQDGVGQTDILQQVEYRKTGVLLTIEPVIFSGNRVDLTVSQEVSTVLPNNASEIASPTISNRNLDTQLSIRDGETVVLGGLIQNTTEDGESGIPVLKDIPIAGNLFRSNAVSQTRTELLVLITAYILQDTDQKTGFTDQLVESLERAAQAPENMQTLQRPARRQRAENHRTQRRNKKAEQSNFVDGELYEESVDSVDHLLNSVEKVPMPDPLEDLETLEGTDGGA